MEEAQLSQGLSQNLFKNTLRMHRLGGPRPSPEMLKLRGLTVALASMLHSMPDFIYYFDGQRKLPADSHAPS